MFTVKVISEDSKCIGCCYDIFEYGLRVCKFPEEKSKILSKEGLHKCINRIDDGTTIYYIHKLVKMSEKIKIL